MSDPSALGSELRRLREAAGLTTMQVSERSHVREAYLVGIEQNREEPSSGALRRIADALDPSGAAFRELARRQSRLLGARLACPMEYGRGVRGWLFNHRRRPVRSARSGFRGAGTRSTGPRANRSRNLAAIRADSRGADGDHATGRTSSLIRAVGWTFSCAGYGLELRFRIPRVGQ